MYRTLDALQSDLDRWIVHYNSNRTHEGKYCFGRTPLETFRQSKHLAKEKMIESFLVDDLTRQDQPFAVVS